MTSKVTSRSGVHKWGGAAFVLGNLLFIVNKLNEMSRLFLGRSMPDVISGQDTLLILIGQVALVIGFVAYDRCYVHCVGRTGRIALRLLTGGGILMAVGHFSFMAVLARLLPFVEYLFLLVIVGTLFLFIGLIWFGIFNLRQPVLNRWHWLPLATGLMGVIGFVLFRGEEITVTFLIFRTLFALGLIGLGVALFLEKPVQPGVVR